MPRLERRGRFCELRRVGSRITIRRGPIDGSSPATTEVRSGTWASEAVHQLAGLVDKLIAEGWTLATWRVSAEGLVGEPSPFEVALAGSPRAEDWAVYGDWLAARGDPRAELIGLALALDSIDGEGDGDGDAGIRLRREHDATLDRLRRRWFGELIELAELGTVLRWWWSHARLRELELGGGPGPLDLDLHAPNDLAGVLFDLLAHPSARLLERLALGALDREARRDVARVLEPLAGLQLPALRRIELGVEFLRSRTAPVRLGNLAALERLPALRSLRIRGELVGLPALDRLERLELELPTIERSLADRLRAGAFPELRRLWIVSERNDPWAALPPAESRAIFERLLARGRTRELAIQGATGLHVLLECDDLDRLHELRLVRLRDADAELLLSHADRLAGIARLVLDEPALERSWERVRERFGDRLQVVRASFTKVVTATHRQVG
ncbi:hypothetical protein ACNOYE_38040 [Nannocystaceae bacterium ST9]